MTYDDIGNIIHRAAAGKIGTFLQTKVMGWSEPERYFLAQDNDSHWYVVPASRKDEWYTWLDLDPDDEAAWNEPEFVKRINGAPSLVNFTDWRTT